MINLLNKSHRKYAICNAIKFISLQVTTSLILHFSIRTPNRTMYV